jgi:hypothetical protein
MHGRTHPRFSDDAEASYSTTNLMAEATRCRELAVEFAGRPEETLLVRLADDFENIATGAISIRSRKPVAVLTAPLAGRAQVRCRSVFANSRAV